MTRLERFQTMPGHLMYKKMMLRLTEDEFDQCVAFIEESEDLGTSEFADKVNRWKLDQPRTKHHTDMWALLLAVKEDA
jgi:hypothetical protein